MNLLIKGATLLTLDPKRPLLKNTDLAVSGKTIHSLGKTPKNFKPTHTLSGKNRLVAPAFHNSHCHSPMTLVRGWAEDLPFDRWLNEKIWVAESALQEEDVYWGAALAACEMIRSGTVSYNDHYFWMRQVTKVVEESGMKALLAWCLFGLGQDKEVGKATLQSTLDFSKDHDNTADGRLKVALGPHSPYMCPDPFLLQVVEASHKHKLPIHLHLSESQEQVDRSKAAHGKTPIAHLDDLGLFDTPCPAIAAHCIAADDDDIRILADKKVVVAHSPKTYMKLGMGMAPLQKFLDHGVQVQFATDGPASNNDMDIAQSMRLAGLFQKNEQRRPEALPHDQLIALAAAGRTLAPGQPADLVIYDTDQAHWTPRHDLAAALAYSSHPADITHVLCDGRWLLKDRELATLDEKRILREAEKRALRMVAAPMKRVRRYRG